ncbi:hypothetical protein BV898_18111 [Hypsibius exemplaris]|uniref:Uncharacterized protein n=1 Tax=Hypsibius exemplaris TaxID=2072580 RepID=A0A9X6RMS9_HYPEX|nr:hypothetical protein BV898_18111 [Hypsibius exemplaris]
MLFLIRKTTWAFTDLIILVVCFAHLIPSTLAAAVPAVPVVTRYAGASAAAAIAMEYGYDQMDQRIYPTIYGPIVAYRRRYGYRHGPFYGYGVYLDVPPFFGYGDVRNGLGIDPQADYMAATALTQGRIISSEVIPRIGQSGLL